MASFTVYIGLVLTGLFGRVPCSCGGVLSSLGWEAHFLFNVCILALAVIGVYGLQDDGVNEGI